VFTYSAVTTESRWIASSHTGGILSNIPVIFYMDRVGSDMILFDVDDGAWRVTMRKYKIDLQSAVKIYPVTGGSIDMVSITKKNDTSKVKRN
jgi:hypothetical protein